MLTQWSPIAASEGTEKGYIGDKLKQQLTAKVTLFASYKNNLIKRVSLILAPV